MFKIIKVDAKGHATRAIAADFHTRQDAYLAMADLAYSTAREGLWAVSLGWDSFAFTLTSEGGNLAAGFCLQEVTK